MFRLTRFRLASLLLVTLLIAVPTPAQQQQPAQPEETPEPDEQPITLGIQLTPQLLDRLLDKAAERLTKDYGFDEYQYEQVRELLHDRVPKFLKEHQPKLQGLLNEYLEALASDQPPTPEYAAEWSERLLPMVGEFRGLVEGFSADMREFMTDDQQVLLDGYLAVFNTGINTVDNRLHEFKEGGFDPELHWPRSEGFREIDREEMTRLRSDMEEARFVAMSGTPEERALAISGSLTRPTAPAGHSPEQRPVATGTPRSTADRGGERAATPAADPTGAGDTTLVADAKPPVAKAGPEQIADEWTRYVQEFIKRYQLDDEQQQKARGFLKQRQTQRENYFVTKSTEIEAITDMFDKAGGDPKKIALAERRRTRLYEPVDRMFEQLKQKLDTLPRRAQRKAAALAEKEESEKPERASRGPADARRP